MSILTGLTPPPARAAGALLVTSAVNHEVFCYDVTTKQCRSFVPPRSGGLDTPFGFTLGPDGNLYVCCNNMDCIKRYDGVTGAFVDVFTSAGSCGLDYPARIAFVCPPILTCQQNVGAGILQLCWTSPLHRLQVQTNSSAGGLTTNWFDYPGGTNSPVTVPLDPQQDSVFYRLTWP